MTLMKKMVLCFLVVILVSLAGFAYTLYQSNRVEHTIASLAENDIPLMERTYDMAYNAMAQTATIRAYFLYGSPHYLQEYQRLAAENAQVETELLQAARKGGDAAEAAEMEELKRLNDAYSEIASKKVVPFIQAGQKEAAMQVLVQELAPAAESLLAKVNDIKQLRRKSIENHVAHTDAAAKGAQTAAYVAALLAAAIGMILAFAAARRITAPIKLLETLMAQASAGDLTVRSLVTSQDEIGSLGHSFNGMVAAQRQIIQGVKSSSLELTAAAEEMAASTTNVSSAAGDIAREVQRVAASMSEAARLNLDTSQVLIELSSLIQIAKDKAHSASTNSSLAIQAAQGGKETVSAAMRSMNLIHHKTKEAEQVITLLHEYSQQIGSINETITGIAKQTNLLALNAAIEAARAGESGRGFAVVAEEVRKLAEQSNGEASTISQLIGKITDNTGNAVVAMKDSLCEVESGVRAVGDAEQSLEHILAVVAETVLEVDGIAKITNDEIASSDRIVEMIETMANDIEETEREAQVVAAATEEISASVETLAASSEETSAMAQSLQNDIICFQV